MKWIKNQLWRCIWSFCFHKCKGDFIYSKVEELYRSTSNKGFCKVAYLGDAPFFDKSLFAQTIWKPFEMLEVPVPIGYDEILKLQYGDYMQFPPVGERGTHQYFDFCADVPYKEYHK